MTIDVKLLVKHLQTSQGAKLIYDLDCEESKVLTDAIDGLWASLAKIDAIRNDIIARQSISWSRHIYPLVAALDEAGYPGVGHEEGRKKALADDEEIAGLKIRLKAAVDCLSEVLGTEEAAEAPDNIWDQAEALVDRERELGT